MAGQGKFDTFFVTSGLFRVKSSFITKRYFHIRSDLCRGINNIGSGLYWSVMHQTDDITKAEKGIERFAQAYC